MNVQITVGQLMDTLAQLDSELPVSVRAWTFLPTGEMRSITQPVNKARQGVVLGDDQVVITTYV